MIVTLLIYSLIDEKVVFPEHIPYAEGIFSVGTKIIWNTATGKELVLHDSAVYT